tara:strand:+ start:842 stop:1756 length:915 start_codon:yes stop_codon:yes gene_type:complete
MRKGGYFNQDEKLQEIKKLLLAKLIRPKKPNINELYNQLGEYDKTHLDNSIGFGNINNLRNPFKDYLASFNDNLFTIAIDFPITLKSRRNTDKTIMICAMDSLPPKPEDLTDNDVFNRTGFCMSKNICFWAPFSLIADWEKPIGSMSSNFAFFEELLKNYNIYITDIYKIFFRTLEGKSNKYTRSNQINRYKKLKINNINAHAAILEREIEIINPDAIITIGNSSRDRLLELNESLSGNKQKITRWGKDLQLYIWKDNIDIISSPHISGGANGAKMKIINAHPITKEEGFENKKLAKLIYNKIK